MKKVIIFGIGAFAEVAHYYLTHDSDYEVVAFTINQKYLDQQTFCDLPVIPFEKIETLYPPNEFSLFIAIGYTNMNKSRAKIFDECKKKGYSMISYVNSKATVCDDLTIVENCFILENNVIQPFVTIGNDVILWSGNHIGHHAIISDHCFISSHVVISGFVKIGSRCFLGVNSTIRDEITIADDCLIGANVYIKNNTNPKEIYKSQDSIKLDIYSDQLNKM